MNKNELNGFYAKLQEIESSVQDIFEKKKWVFENDYGKKEKIKE